MIKKINSTHFLSLLILSSFLLRLAAVYFFRDTHIDNEWNILLKNLINYQSYSYYEFSGLLIPSVYMPPIYAVFLYLVKLITTFDGAHLVYSIIFIQVVLSTYTIYLFYELNKFFFTNNISLINSFIFSSIPLNIYACGQISSINLQMIFSLLFLKYLLLIAKKENFKNICIFSITTGLLIMTRGEFILIFFLIFIFIFLSKKIKPSSGIKIIIIITLVISPYLTRNYYHFNQIFIVKSLGYNLWKGNNELSKVEGYENLEKIEFKDLKSQVESLKKNKYYEINRDDIFLNKAINNISENPIHYIGLFFTKFFSYYFVDLNSNYPNYYNLFHIFPIILVSILSFPGLFFFSKTKKFNNKCVALYLFSNLIIFSLFFVLPRYKLIILPVQIILATYFIKFIIEKYESK
jgi:4-amino-4-deoxy-L-arabinose transferase-like glycosyltransferase